MADKKRVRTTGFITRFEVEEGLAVTAEGVELTAAELDKVQKAAKRSGTQLIIDDVKATETQGTDTSTTETEGADTATTETTAAGTRARGGRS